MVTTRPPKTIVKPTALGPVANTDTKLLIYGLFQKGRVLGQDGVARPTEQENLDPQPQRNRRRQEDVSKGEPSRGETGLHSRSSDLTSELQSSVRSDEVVIATEQLQVLIEPLRRASVGKRSSRSDLTAR